MRNSPVRYVRHEYSCSIPEVEHTPRSLNYPRQFRHSVTDPLMKPITPSAAGGGSHARTNHSLTGQGYHSQTWQDTSPYRNGRLYEENALCDYHDRQYEGGFSERSSQPSSFPVTQQAQQGGRHSKPYSSLDTISTSGSSFSHHPTYYESTHLSHDHHSHEGSASASFGGVMPSQVHPQSSRGGDQHVQQLSDTKQSYSKDTIQVESRAMEERQTAGSVEPSHRPMSSSASAGPSSAPRPYTSKSRSLDFSGDHVIPQSPNGEYCSQATLENARYSLDTIPMSDHSNEDRFFAVESTGFKVFCVCDGHNGSRASGFASNYLMKMFYKEFWKKLVSNPNCRSIVCEALLAIFMDTEKEFFKSIERYVKEKDLLQSKIPQVRNSFKRIPL